MTRIDKRYAEIHEPPPSKELPPSEHGMLPGLRAGKNSWMDQAGGRRCGNCHVSYPPGSLWVEVPDSVAEGDVTSREGIARECRRLNQSGVIWCLRCAQGLGAPMTPMRGWFAKWFGL